MQKITKKNSETSTDVSLQQNKAQLFLYQKGFNESLRVRSAVLSQRMMFDCVTEFAENLHSKEKLCQSLMRKKMFIKHAPVRINVTQLGCV